jgi:hypothetical protein
MPMGGRNTSEHQSQLDFQAAAGHNHNEQLNQKSAVGSADGMLCRHYAKLRTLCATLQTAFKLLISNSNADNLFIVKRTFFCVWLYGYKQDRKGV